MKIRCIRITEKNVKLLRINKCIVDRIGLPRANEN